MFELSPDENTSSIPNESHIDKGIHTGSQGQMEALSIGRGPIKSPEEYIPSKVNPFKQRIEKLTGETAEQDKQRKLKLKDDQKYSELVKSFEKLGTQEDKQSQDESMENLDLIEPTNDRSSQIHKIASDSKNMSLQVENQVLSSLEDMISDDSSQNPSNLCSPFTYTQDSGNFFDNKSQNLSEYEPSEFSQREDMKGQISIALEKCGKF